jgi:hypothetical protein
LASRDAAKAYTIQPANHASGILKQITQASATHGDKQKGQTNSSPNLFVHISVLDRKGASKDEWCHISIICQVAKAATKRIMVTSMSANTQTDKQDEGSHDGDAKFTDYQEYEYRQDVTQAKHGYFAIHYHPPQLREETNYLV